MVQNVKPTPEEMKLNKDRAEGKIGDFSCTAPSCTAKVREDYFSIIVLSYLTIAAGGKLFSESKGFMDLMYNSVLV